MPSSLGISLALPDNARLDRAFRDARALPTPIVGASLDYKASGNWYELVDSMYARFTTDATAGNRIVFARLIDDQGVVIFDVPAAAPQVAGAGVRYLVTADLGSTYNSGQGFQVITIPPLLLLPTWTLRLTWGGVAGNDQMDLGFIVTTKVPTGPKAPPTEASVTPLIV